MKLVYILSWLLVYCFLKSDRVFGEDNSLNEDFQDSILDETQALVKEDWAKLFELIRRMSKEVVVVSERLVTYNVELDASARKINEYKDGRKKLADDIHQKNVSFYRCLGIHCDRKKEIKGTQIKTDVGRLWRALKATISTLSEQLLQVNKAVTSLDVEPDRLLSTSTKEEHYSYTTLRLPHFC